MGSGTNHTIKSSGICFSLPTHSDRADLHGFTALVTGLNGISGYHMVRVLAAAPERWSKIFCASRRHLPDYLYRELGEGENRVQHIEADVLSDPSRLAHSLKCIDKE